MKIVVLGYIIRGPLGGLVWHHFQYVYGLVKMGYDVLFLEDSEEYAACYNPETLKLTTDPGYGLKFIKNIFHTYDLDKNWAYFDFHTNTWFGKTKKEVDMFLKEADILLNISGVNPLREWSQNIPCRIFIDTDPVFTQIRHLTDPDALKLAKQHNVFFSFGENYGKEGCGIPNDGIDWKPTRQPVVSDLWKNKNIKKEARWTTVMQWDSYKTAQWNDRSYGMKSESFGSYIKLPELENESFELAIGSETAPKEKLKNVGWHITDPLIVTKTPESYQCYINNSKGEWSIAKHGYVISNSGWFSERSAVYLASGKPVVLQDTGFSKHIPTRKGLLVFTNLDEAIEAIQNVNHDYKAHCKAARQIAKEYFSAYKVLKDMLSKIV